MHWLLRTIRDLCAPRGCAACDEVVASRVAFCALCAAAVNRHPTGLRTMNSLPIHVPFAYGGALSQAILRLKFERRSDLAEPLGELLVTELRCVPFASSPSSASFAAPITLVPVPSTRERLRERGFNPAGLLAGVLGRAWRLPVAHRLSRSSASVAQLGLSRAERLHNAAAAFHLKKSAASPVSAAAREHCVTTPRIVLVDDVVTTGATLDACAEALKRANLWVIGAVTLASADI